MARTINFDEALDEDDIAYMASRPWLIAEARRHGVELPDDLTNTTPDPGARSVTETHTSTAPTAKEPAVIGSVSPTENGRLDSDDDFRNWKKAELQAKIEELNADIEDEDDKIVPASDKNDDLAEALEEYFAREESDEDEDDTPPA